MSIQLKKEVTVSYYAKTEKNVILVHQYSVIKKTLC